MNITRATEILLEVKQILDNHNVEFFLDFGTLLGIVRDKAILPWDTDVDLGMLYEDAPNLLKITNVFKEHEYSVWIHCNNYTLFKDHIPLTIACFQPDDTIRFLIDYVSPTSFTSKLQTIYDISCFREHASPKCSQDGERSRVRKIHRIAYWATKYGISRWLVKTVSYRLWKWCGGFNDAYVTPAHFLEQYDQVHCYGTVFNTPHPIEEYLVFKYGEDWRTPKPVWSMEEDWALTHSIEKQVKTWKTLEEYV